MKNIAILFGGKSSEYMISLQSATAFLKAIDNTEYKVYPLGITQQGYWYYYTGEYENIINNTWICDIAHLQSAYIAPNGLSQLTIIKDNYILNQIHIDAALPLMHGNNGEDGSMAALLQLANIVNLSCNLTAGCLAYDKYRSHLIAKASGINVAKSMHINAWDLIDIDKIEQSIGYPCVVKPCCAGSSFGICLVHNSNQLKQALNDAFKYDDQCLIEEFIDGVEIGISIIGNQKLIVSNIDCIEAEGLFDYQQKYESDKAKVSMPNFDLTLKETIINTAILLYRIHKCDTFARIDMFLTKDNDLYFNEINTIPGLTNHSRFPKMMESIGFNFAQVVNLILNGGNA